MTPAVLHSTSNHSKERFVGNTSCKISTISPKRINPATINIMMSSESFFFLADNAHSHKNEAVV